MHAKHGFCAFLSEKPWLEKFCNYQLILLNATMKQKDNKRIKPKLAFHCTISSKHTNPSGKNTKDVKMAFVQK